MNNTVLHSDLIVWYSVVLVDSCGIADNIMQSQDGMVIMSTRGMTREKALETSWAHAVTIQF